MDQFWHTEAAAMNSATQEVPSTPVLLGGRWSLSAARTTDAIVPENGEESSQGINNNNLNFT